MLRRVGLRWIVPEVVQTSAMDCGPASIASLLNGFGIRVSYGRLREACQTDVDGTSIDVLETVAVCLGLQAEQVMLPLDHLLLAESSALPAIVVTRTALGQTHFVVVWRCGGPFVQVMDPAVGRRWMRRSQLLDDVYIHTHAVPAEAIDSWMRSDSFQRVIRRRLRDIGVCRAGRALIRNSVEETGWQGPAALDAAIRLTSSLVSGGAIRRGSQARRMVEVVWKKAAADRSEVPEPYWFVLPGEPNAAKTTEEQVRIRGAVLVRAIGVRDKSDEADGKPIPTELKVALRESGPRPWRTAWGIIGSGATRVVLALLLIVLLMSGLSLVELVFLRGFIDLGRDLGLVQQRLAAVAMLCGIGVVLLVLDFLLTDGWQRLGRKLEIGFRMAFAKKIPRLNDRYFHSRPVSDMAERSHMVQQLREMPRLFGQIAQTSLMLILTSVAIAIFDPASGPLALVIAGISLALPMLFRPWLTELDMRVRTHAGALTQFYFDAMHGLSAIRAHVADRVLLREQESLLVEWVQASRRHLFASLLLEGLQLTSGIGLAAWLVVQHVNTLASTGGALLLAWWALSLPELAGQLASLTRQYPRYRNVLLRLLEPLGAPEERMIADKPAARQTSQAPGASIELEQVTVVAAGHCILKEISLRIAPGSHVAIVGPSGGGKSTLLGLLLGWHKPAAGRAVVDGVPLTEAALAGLRRQTAWVDPAIQIWNESLVDNLRFGHEDVDANRLGSACQQSQLIELLEKLPNGLQTQPGEGGGLLSGGQGQRLRLGRAMLKDDARLVLMDEAFRGLDRDQRRELTGRMRKQFKDATILFVSHDVSDTQDFDRVLVVSGGEIVEDADPRELASQSDSRYRQLLDSEEEVNRTIWSAAQWRHLWLNDGRLKELECGEDSTTPATSDR